MALVRRFDAGQRYLISVRIGCTIIVSVAELHAGQLSRIFLGTVPELLTRRPQVVLLAQGRGQSGHLGEQWAIGRKASTNDTCADMKYGPQVNLIVIHYIDVSVVADCVCVGMELP